MPGVFAYPFLPAVNEADTGCGERIPGRRAHLAQILQAGPLKRLAYTDGTLSTAGQPRSHW